MKKLLLKIKNIEGLNGILKTLLARGELTSEQCAELIYLLHEIPPADLLIAKKFKQKTVLRKSIEVKVWDYDKTWPHIEKWCKLFKNLPGNNSPNIFEGGSVYDIKEIKERNVMIAIYFSPSYDDDMRNNVYRLYLKVNGMAKFDLPAKIGERFPELYNFKGNWEQAYLTLASTMQRNWPKESFPAKLQKFLKM